MVVEVGISEIDCCTHAIASWKAHLPEMAEGRASWNFLIADKGTIAYQTCCVEGYSLCLGRGAFSQAVGIKDGGRNSDCYCNV